MTDTALSLAVAFGEIVATLFLLLVVVSGVTLIVNGDWRI